MLRIMLTGASGQVGWALQSSLASLGQLTLFHRAQLDIGDADAIRRAVRALRPDLIVNAAGYTAVDQAETEPEVALRVNGNGPGILAEEAKHAGAALISFSSDYVFDGLATQPYTEDDAANALSAYGRSKLAGDRAIAAVDGSYLIFRTSWIYCERGRNFLLTVLKLAKDREEVRIVDDQVGAPTPSHVIADAVAQIAAQASALTDKHSLSDVLRERRGLYNLTCGGQVSWYGFAKEILRVFPPQRCPRLVPIPASEYPSAARRPAFSVLSTQKLVSTFGFQPPHWEQALERFAEHMRARAIPFE